MAKKKAKKKENTIEEKIEEKEEELYFDFEEDDEDATPALLEDVDGIQLPAGWGQSMTAMDEVIRHRQSFNLKHGMFANVPMICKGTVCPLHEICTIPIRKRPVFHRCPIEIAAIIDRYDKYCEELGIGPEDYLDQSQVKDLVDIEIKLLRANGHLAISGDFIQEVVQAIDDKGNTITRPELHKATEYEEKLLNRKKQILSELNATRRAKNHKEAVKEASSFASELMRKAMMAKNKIIDVTPEDNIDNDTETSVEQIKEGDVHEISK